MRNIFLLLTLSIYLIFPAISNGQNVPTGVQSPVVGGAVVPSAYNSNNFFSYTREWIPDIPVSDPSFVKSPDRTIKEVGQATTYFDGLGRPLQFVTKGSTPGGRDMVIPYYYDSVGRSTRRYLPYVASGKDGLVKEDPFNEQISSYNSLSGYEQEKYLYSSTIIENSALGRPLKSYMPGNGLAGMGIGKNFEYGINKDADQVRIFKLGEDNAQLPYSSGVYAAGELYKITNIDEDGNKVVEYQDKDRKLILKKSQLDSSATQGHTGWLYTYYVYNDLGALSLVITPKAAVALESTGWLFSNPDILNKLCYQYSYDSKGRMIVKKAGGSLPEYLVYDRRDRISFSQDGNQRKDGTWIVMFYDDLNRPVMTAEYKSTLTRAELQQRMDTASLRGNAITVTYRVENPKDLILNGQETASANFIAENTITILSGFNVPAGEVASLSLDTSSRTITETISAYLNPLPGITEYNPLSVFHYDNYNWRGAKEFNSGITGKLNAGGQNYVQKVEPDKDLTDQMTGKQIRIIQNGKEQWVASTYYYDNKGRKIQSLSENINGGVDIISAQYNFSGDVLSQYLLHNNPVSKTSPVTTILTKYKYDDGGRLKTISQVLNDNTTSEKVVSELTYDTLGRIRSKSLGQIDILEYDYSITGRLAAINRNYVRNGGAGFFGMELTYDYGFTNTRKNGNLSGLTWRRKGDNGYRSYGYKYDGSNRLQQSDFSLKEGNSWTQSKENYSVNNLQYDPNGNIQKMDVYATVFGATKPVDKLNYTYEPSGDRLTEVHDDAGYQEQHDFKDGINQGADYNYDSIGNLLADKNKGMSFIWNSVIDKPVELSFDSLQNKIQYIYDAEGYRWRKNVIEGNKTTSYTYISGFVYRNDTLLFFSQPNGRVRRTAKGNLVYDYYESDNLGNIRAVLTEEKDTAFYAATFEESRNAVENATFSNREETKEAISTAQPWYNAQTNKYWSKLNGSVQNKRIGAAIVLKVMAGDIIDLQTKAYYQSNGAENNTATVDQMLTNLISVFLGNNSSTIPNGKNNLLQGGNTILNATDFNSFINNNQQNAQPGSPKAYLNYVLFDEDFNIVSGTVKRIDGGADALNTYNGHLDVSKSGYVYVYTSNESPVDVWFDDLQVTHQSGPLLQESTLYPYGLEIASQSNRHISKTANDYLYQGKQLDEEFDVALYYFGARYYDPQTGRFISLDPARQFASGYAGMGNNPAMFVDPDGRFVPLLALLAGAIIGGVTNVVSHWDEISSAPNFGQGLLRGVGYTATGVVSGLLYATGNVGGGVAVGAVGNGIFDIISGHSPEQAANTAMMGVITAPITNGIVNGASSVIGPVISSVVKGPAIRAAITTGISQAVGAQVSGTGIGLLSGRSFGESFKSALPGTLIAAGTGSISGYMYGVAWARKYDIDPISGKYVGTIEKIQTVQINTEISTALEGPASQGNYSFTMVADVAGGSSRGNTLFHYTNEAGYKAITSSGEIFPSIGIKNARHGPGQYLTDIAPGELTVGQTSRRLYGVPWNTTKLTHYLEINVSGLNVIKNAPYNYVIPGTGNLPLGGRIVNGGVSIFK